MNISYVTPLGVVQLDRYAWIQNEHVNTISILLCEQAKMYHFADQEYLALSAKGAYRALAVFVQVRVLGEATSISTKISLQQTASH